MNVFQWLRYGPWLAQVVVTRRCNLKCGYCTEYDRTSDPAPYDELALRLAKLAELRAWAVCLTVASRLCTRACRTSWLR